MSQMTLKMDIERTLFVSVISTWLFHVGSPADLGIF
jgi:hypothetical protein